MTYQDDFTLPTELLDQVAEQGLDFLPELIRIVVNTAMQLERQKYLGVGPYERSTERHGHSIGIKPKTVSTRIAPITFDIPQVREGGFYPQALEKGLRSERALMLAMAEMYVQGVSTRKVAAITEKLCGSKISSTQVSGQQHCWIKSPCRYGTVRCLEALAQSPVGDSHLLVPGCSVREGTG